MDVCDCRFMICPLLGLDHQGAPTFCRGDMCMGWKWELPGDNKTSDGFCQLISFPPELTLGPDKD